MEGQARSQLVFLLQWESRLQSCELEVGQVSRMQMHQAFSGCTSAVSGWSQWMLNKQLGWPTCVQPTHQAASSQTGYVAKALLFISLTFLKFPQSLIKHFPTQYSLTFHLHSITFYVVDIYTRECAYLMFQLMISSWLMPKSHHALRNAIAQRGLCQSIIFHHIKKVILTTKTKILLFYKIYKYGGLST